MSIPVITGVTPTAPKLILHGLPSSGKSTLAAKLKKPIFLDFEGGLNYIDCVRTPLIKNDVAFNMVVESLKKDAKAGKKEYETVVIDSIDWCVRLFEEVAAGVVEFDNRGVAIKKDFKATLNKANGGYGNGAAHLVNLIRSDFIPRLNSLVELDYGVCLIAHSERKSIMDADGVNTDRIAPKIHDKVVDPFIEWADDVFYLKHDNGTRTLLLDGDSNVLAKNRQGLTGEVKVDEIDINELLAGKKGNK